MDGEREVWGSHGRPPTKPDRSEAGPGPPEGAQRRPNVNLDLDRSELHRSRSKVDVYFLHFSAPCAQRAAVGGSAGRSGGSEGRLGGRAGRWAGGRASEWAGGRRSASR